MQGGGAAGGGAAAAGAHQAMMNAVKASGAIIKVLPEEFNKVLYKLKEPLVVYSEFHFFSTSYKYLVSHKGLVFYTRSPQPLELPSGTEVIRAQKVWIPSN